jgi:hypothetical protein
MPGQEICAPAPVRSRPFRRPGWRAATVVAVMVLAAGCSSSGSKPHVTAADRSRARYESSSAMLAQCAINHGSTAVLTSARKYNDAQSRNQVWLTGETVGVDDQTDTSFNNWWDNGGGAAVVLGGRQLGDWELRAARNRRLPAQVCGTAIAGGALRDLYRQVYANWPSALSHDPW